MRSLILIVALGLGYTLEASAQGGPGAASFDAIDADGDGVLSEAEMQQFSEMAFEERFARADADGDGALNAAEMEAMRSERTDRRMQRMMGRLDRNNDGLLQYVELSQMAGRNRIFGRLDANQDGEVSRDEFERRRN
ncbi:EF-hand domain-containing protein [Aestuariibius sp. 2305UL40-4]|uniref:EF-hand domain-containing protein n=1 Tax=Aestuariibius violaceus TaxID=3234132 RepID=UPI00345EFC58